MKTPTRYVRALSEQEQQLLRELYLSHPVSRVRCRAHGVLLSSRGFSINEISRILEVTRETVASWLTEFESSGCGGLHEGKRSGRPKKIKGEHESILKKFVVENPQNAVREFQCHLNTHGVEISGSTIRRGLNELGLSWKRLRKSLACVRDEQQFRSAQKELSCLQERARSGTIDLYYFDESGFSLQPSVPYGWQPKGETVALPACNHNKRVNALGFLNYNGEQLESLTFESNIESSIVEYAFNWFSQQHPRKETIVVLDNARFHTSDDVLEAIEMIEENSNISFFFLPPYSPELNLIEILWRKIKYSWIPVSAYATWESMKSSIEKILAQFGTKYRISFA